MAKRKNPRIEWHRRVLDFALLVTTTQRSEPWANQRRALKPFFDRALEIEAPDKRDAYLAKACSGDPGASPESGPAS